MKTILRFTLRVLLSTTILSFAFMGLGFYIFFNRFPGHTLEINSKFVDKLLPNFLTYCLQAGIIASMLWEVATNWREIDQYCKEKAAFYKAKSLGVK